MNRSYGELSRLILGEAVRDWDVRRSELYKLNGSEERGGASGDYVEKKVRDRLKDERRARVPTNLSDNKT